MLWLSFEFQFVSYARWFAAVAAEEAENEDEEFADVPKDEEEVAAPALWSRESLAEFVGAVVDAVAAAAPPPTHPTASTLLFSV